MLHKDYYRKGSVAKEESLAVSQDELIGGKLPVGK
jgi:hypothetical protein